ncbi:MAG: PAS domain S-box protein [Gloeocapsa sp. DLM2.Bin57]|nr:MAG: PAS domain S-box protein [Gloeocapsa sp. DLM2.Bin57]
MTGNTVNKTNKTSRKFKLRTVLVVPFVLQIVTAVAIVGYLSFRNGQKAIGDLATQLSQQASSRVSQQLSHYLAVPQQVNGINLQALELGLINSEDVNTMGQFFWKQMKLFNDLSEINFGSSQGTFIGIGREDNGSLYREMIQPGAGNLSNRYALDDQGNPTEILESDEYEFQEDTWYKSAVISGQPIWSPIYQWSARDQRHLISLSYSYPVYDSSNELVGVLAVEFILNQISDFLRSLDISPSSKIFIMERDGMIVASSSLERPYLKVDGEAEGMKVSESQDPLILDTANQLRDYFGTFDQITTSEIMPMKINQKQTFVSVIHWKHDSGLNWVIVVIIPESDFMSHINANTRHTIALCLATLILSIIIGILTARSITRPIIQITNASEEIATGNLDKRVESDNFIEIQEIDTLEHSFNSMAGQLKKTFESLEAKNEELRIAEENYRSIFENALEGIFQSSPSGRYLNVNPALAKIYGYDSPAEMVENITNIGEQVYVDLETRIEFRELLETQGILKDFQYRSYCKDNSIIWTQIDARVVKDKQGNILYYEGTVQDISDRKRREDELKRQLEELKIEIDHNKREKEVANLTNSSLFQEVQQEMAEVNLDEFWG